MLLCCLRMPRKLISFLIPTRQFDVDVEAQFYVNFFRFISLFSTI